MHGDDNSFAAVVVDACEQKPEIKFLYDLEMPLRERVERIAKEVGVRHLPNDFKKNGGYDMARELAERYELYRQNYCGCTPYIPE